MDLRTYRPALPPGTIYRPHTLLERLCRETPPPAPPKQNAKTIIHGRQPEGIRDAIANIRQHADLTTPPTA